MDDYYSKLKGKILNSQKDEVLQTIVKKAAEVSGFPISLINIVLRRTQFFRAFTGIPQDLSEVRATDRCVSFCQYVVNNKRPLKIADAKADTSLPQLLVNLYGIRSYYGAPVKLYGEIIGSLCVIDIKPRIISEVAEKAMTVLAEEASHRLEELAKISSPIKVEQQTRETWWEALTAAQLDVNISMVELSAFMKAHKVYGEDKANGSTRLAAFREAAKSYDDLSEAVARVNELIRSLKATRPALKASGAA